jgi:acyl-CoA thioester hydrolase, YbgC/YbaW family
MNKFKVYYEDTDASGRVYHANYLRFLERGRTNIIYKSKYTHKILLNKFNIIFVVKSCSINFIKPAFFEDTIEVLTSVKEISRVKIIFFQKILKKKDILLEAEVLIIPVNNLGKISKLPEEIFLYLKNLN